MSNYSHAGRLEILERWDEEVDEKLARLTAEISGLSFCGAKQDALDCIFDGQSLDATARKTFLSQLEAETGNSARGSSNEDRQTEERPRSLDGHQAQGDAQGSRETGDGNDENNWLSQEVDILRGSWAALHMKREFVEEQRSLLNVTLKCNRSTSPSSMGDSREAEKQAASIDSDQGNCPASASLTSSQYTLAPSDSNAISEKTSFALKPSSQLPTLDVKLKTGITVPVTFKVDCSVLPEWQIASYEVTFEWEEEWGKKDKPQQLYMLEVRFGLDVPMVRGAASGSVFVYATPSEERKGSAKGRGQQLASLTLGKKFHKKGMTARISAANRALCQKWKSGMSRSDSKWKDSLVLSKATDAINAVLDSAGVSLCIQLLN